MSCLFFQAPLVYFNQKPSTEVLSKIREAQENVEKLLTGHKFMGGDSLTVADYSYITLMDVLEVYCPTEGKFPLTEKWFERCRSTMKDFEKVNKNGSSQRVAAIKRALAS
uniref:GST C-terminal domain-containing protein n=1 Tax=Graphocephala atropunctata TaxID=36148 RepID=A0A1B6KVU0_9HEMI